MIISSPCFYDVKPLSQPTRQSVLGKYTTQQPNTFLYHKVFPALSFSLCLIVSPIHILRLDTSKGKAV
jgi:hypothetical protein